jgi:hypothetical protein
VFIVLRGLIVAGYATAVKDSRQLIQGAAIIEGKVEAPRKLLIYCRFG